MLIKRITASALALLILATLLVGVLPAYASVSADKYDYSLPGSTVKTVGAAEILENYINGSLTTAEREYLVEFSDTELKYSDGITTAEIIAIPTAGGLTVRAHEYSYVASNGQSIVWIPESAELLGETKHLTLDADGSYVAEFSSIADATDSTAVRVSYSLDLTVDTELLDYIANYAYNAIPTLRADLAAKDAEYKALFADFTGRDNAHKNYLLALDKYNSDLAAYNKWKSFTDQKKAHDDYLAAMDKYNNDMQAHLDSIEARDTFFAAQQSWKEYTDALAEYNAALDAHNAYSAEVAPYLSRIEIMDFVNQKMTEHQRSLYWAIHGTTVDSVLAQRDSFTELAGVPGAVIDLAESATLRLRTLLSEYVTITGDAAKYLYYKQNYDDIKNEFRNLLCALDFLYRNGTVRGMIKQMSDASNDRNRKYQILLAQLFVMVNALWDEPVKSLDPSYVVGSSVASGYKQYTYGSTFRIDPDNKYTVDQVLGGESYVADTNSGAPLAADFPTRSPHPGDPPTTDMTDPGDTPPAYIPKPDDIDPVAPPEGEEPPFVAHPGDPLAPVDPAGDPPTPYTPPATVTALLEAADSIAHRDVPDGTSFAYTVTKIVEKRFINVETVTVDFYDTDGITRLYTSTVDRGTAISYAGPYAPTKAEDARAVYTFAGWQTLSADGTAVPVDLGAVYSDTVLYPRFDEKIKEYTVSFVTDSGTTALTLPYGTIPEYTGDTSKPHDQTYLYYFDGWDTAPVAVVGDATYTARYRREYVAPTTEGGATVTVSGDSLTADFRSSADKSFVIDSIVDLARGKYSVTLVTRYATFSFTSSTAESLLTQGACRVFLENSSEGGKNFYTVVCHNADGEQVGLDTQIVLTVGVSYQASDRLKLSYSQSEGVLGYLSYTLDGHSLSFRATPSTRYTLGYEYRAEAVSTAIAPVSVDSAVRYAGDTVTVTVGNPDTVRTRRLYYKTADGTTVEIEGNSFVMPRSDVTVYAETEYVTYKITFRSDGHTLATVICKVGELPAVPESPKKSADSEFSYEFIGWSSEVVAATADATYDAVYRSVPIEDKVDTGRGITLFMLINMAAVGVFGILFVAIPATVMSIVVMRRFRKNLLHSGKRGANGNKKS